MLTFQIKLQLSDHQFHFLSLVITRYVVTLKKNLPVFSDVSGSVQTVNVLVLPMFSGCGSCLLLDKISHLKQC